jgi:3-oxoadipate enol-lactonase
MKIGTAEVWNDRLATARAKGMAGVVDATMARWFTPAFRAEAARLLPWRHMVARTPLEGFLAVATAIRDTDLRGAAPSIRVPTLVVGGAEDGGTPPDLARALADAVPGARLEILPGVAHLPCVEDPDAYAVLLTTFLREAGQG